MLPDNHQMKTKLIHKPNAIKFPLILLILLALTLFFSTKSPEIPLPLATQKELFSSTRSRLEKVLSSKILPSHLILLPSAQVMLRDESDMELPGWYYLFLMSYKY